MDQAVWASRASLVVGLRPQLDRRDPAAVIRARFNETTKVRTKSDDSDSDFRWLKLFFSSRDSYWSPTGDDGIPNKSALEVFEISLLLHPAPEQLTPFDSELWFAPSSVERVAEEIGEFVVAPMLC